MSLSGLSMHHLQFNSIPRGEFDGVHYVLRDFVFWGKQIVTKHKNIFHLLTFRKKNVSLCKDIQSSVYAHSLICISYRKYEIDYFSLFMSFHVILADHVTGIHAAIHML
jgi:hypothetical protein